MAAIAGAGLILLLAHSQNSEAVVRGRRSVLVRGGWQFSDGRQPRHPLHPHVDRSEGTSGNGPVPTRSAGQEPIQSIIQGVVCPDFPSFDGRSDALLSKERALAHSMLNGYSDLKTFDFADFG